MENDNEKEVKRQKATPYKNPIQQQDEDDPEVKAFAEGNLTKFHQNKAETDTVPKDTDAQKDPADPNALATPDKERPVNAEERVFKKRYDDLKRHYDSTINKHKDEVSTLKDQLGKQNLEFVPPKSKEELDQWKAEYPDVYKMIETISMNKADDRAKELEEKYQLIQSQQQQVSKEKAEVDLLKKHPDFVEIRETDDFHNWATEQEPTIQNWLYENKTNATLAARAIDLYKMDKGIGKYTKKQEKDVRKEAAKAVTKTKKATEGDAQPKKVWSAYEISKLKPREFEKYEAEIEKARVEGRITN